MRTAIHSLLFKIWSAYQTISAVTAFFFLFVVGVDSNLLTPALTSQLDAMVSGPRVRWRLLYRSSRDGWRPKTFHQLCDGQGATVTVARVTGGPLVGGYTQAAWGSEGHGNFSDATAFLFNNRTDAATITKFPIKPNQVAVMHPTNMGPGVRSLLVFILFF